MRYALYVLRWAVLAIPGAWFLIQVQAVIQNTYIAMLTSQAILGAIIYFVDKQIFTGVRK